MFHFSHRKKYLPVVKIPLEKNVPVRWQAEIDTSFDLYEQGEISLFDSMLSTTFRLDGGQPKQPSRGGHSVQNREAQGERIGGQPMDAQEVGRSQEAGDPLQVEGRLLAGARLRAESQEFRAGWVEQQRKIQQENLGK